MIVWTHKDGRVIEVHPRHKKATFPVGWPVDGYAVSHPTRAVLERSVVPHLTEAEWYGCPGRSNEGWTREEVE